MTVRLSDDQVERLDGLPPCQRRRSHLATDEILRQDNCLPKSYEESLYELTFRYNRVD